MSGQCGARAKRRDTTRKLLAMWNGGESESVIENVFSKTFSSRYPFLDAPVTTLDGYRKGIAMWKSVFNPFRLTPSELMDGPNENQITFRWTVSGNFAASFPPHSEIKPHNKFVAMDGICIVTFDELNKVIDEWILFDGDDFLKRLRGDISPCPWSK